MEKHTINYDTGTLIIAVRDIFGSATDVIVNPANSGLSHGGGLAAQIAIAAGPELEAECEAYITEHGTLPETHATATTAGKLDYKAVIHTVGPRMGSGNEQQKIADAVRNSLTLCEQQDWHSIACPAISTGIFGVPDAICANAYAEAIAPFLARSENTIERVEVCLTTDHYPAFLKAFGKGKETAAPPSINNGSGSVELGEEDIAALQEDGEIDGWFK